MKVAVLLSIVSLVAASGCSGVCQDVTKNVCETYGGFRTGVCPGPSNVRCCPTPPPSRCGGSCADSGSMTCSTGFMVGKCPGSAAIKCCGDTGTLHNSPGLTTLAPPAAKLDITHELATLLGQTGSSSCFQAAAADGGHFRAFAASLHNALLGAPSVLPYPGYKMHHQPNAVTQSLPSNAAINSRLDHQAPAEISSAKRAALAEHATLNALNSLAQGLTGLSTAVSTCENSQLAHALARLAAAVRSANVTSGVQNMPGSDVHPHTIAIKLGATVNSLAAFAKLAEDIEAAVESKSMSGFATALTNLDEQWSGMSSVETCLKSTTTEGKVCRVLSGLLRVGSVGTHTFVQCRTALTPVYQHFEVMISDFKAAKTAAAFGDLAEGVDEIAKVLQSSQCGLTNLGHVLEKVYPSLTNVTNHLLHYGPAATKASAVYQAAYNTIQGFVTDHLQEAGSSIIQLTTAVAAEGCTTDVCKIGLNIASAAGTLIENFDACKGSFHAIQSTFQGFSGQQVDFWDISDDIGAVTGDLSAALQSCGVNTAATKLEKVFSFMSKNHVVRNIGNVERLLQDGTDITSGIHNMHTAYQAKNWPAFTSSLLNLDPVKYGCTNVACKVMDGLLQASNLFMSDLSGCKSVLEEADHTLGAGFHSFHNGRWKDGLESISDGLHTLMGAWDACGVQQEVGYAQQEAKLLKIHVPKSIGDKAQILVHGKDIYDEIWSAFDEYRHGDYSAAGRGLGKSLGDMYKWTNGKACTSEWCYVVMGGLSAFGDLSGDLKKCENDWKMAWHTMSWGVGNISQIGRDHFAWSRSKHDLTTGIHNFGHAAEDVKNGINDCHVEEFLELIEHLIELFGVAPEVGGIEEAIKIVIHAVDIADEVSGACAAWGTDWVTFGFDVFKLAKQIL